LQRLNFLVNQVLDPRILAGKVPHTDILNAIMEIKKYPGIVFLELFIMAQKVQQSTLGYGKRKCTLVDFI
jgi:hypothetical protein